jgi:undecaprenyl-diphosphatase
MIQHLIEWDSRLFLGLNGLAGSGWDYLLGWVTFLGTPALYLVVFLFVLIWDAEKPFQRFSVVVVAGLIASQFSGLGKAIFERKRPYEFFYDDIAKGRVKPQFLFETLVSNSFPSGHTALIFGVAVALHLLYGRKALFVYPLAFWFAISRVYVGAHFPSDVIGGAVLGAIAGWLTVSVMKRTAPRLGIFRPVE